MIQPPGVRYAGFLTAAEGVAALVVAVVLLVRAIGGADQHIVNGWGTAVWFILIGGGVVAGGWALITGRRWGRGIAVITNLLLLPVAWYIITSHHVVYGVLLGLLALGTLVLLFTPSAVEWLTHRD
ncbi:hypothetical protein [Mycolicibacterium goodii]|uniref:Integral membrane protein n=1 Tax=Mycolicibacterium goodii TaxID=134601 RepID=A0ABS6HPA7_MYCGD|nr:hypothetical protein [Mycolicibacterium goodii]OKH65320.1 membrane protein [Mycobacterium sp. SWH-M5]MBU8809888.1 hypothetical protein [Mycolicibacterium goodii]MBU8815517.1 hypothetical protein [Mycolicibacterium goodii]MBU8823102.1 hypothetical protein [Mycolicibacterium goodii]MBU8831197.1 hypothetical protein [Mycolicibacterium goodii]